MSAKGEHRAEEITYRIEFVVGPKVVQMLALVHYLPTHEPSTGSSPQSHMGAVSALRIPSGI